MRDWFELQGKRGRDERELLRRERMGGIWVAEEEDTTEGHHRWKKKSNFLVLKWWHVSLFNCIGILTWKTYPCLLVPWKFFSPCPPLLVEIKSDKAIEIEKHLVEIKSVKQDFSCPPSDLISCGINSWSYPKCMRSNGGNTIYHS